MSAESRKIAAGMLIWSVCGFLSVSLQTTKVYAQSEMQKSCRVWLTARNEDTKFRKDLFKLVSTTQLLVCPFSDGEPVEMLDISCGATGLEGLGKVSVEAFDRQDFYKEAIDCSPLLGIESKRHKPDSVRSYLITNNNRPFDPGIYSKDDNALDRGVRQLLNGLGAPIVYYNTMSTIICLSIPAQEHFSLPDYMNDVDLELPKSISIETSMANCPALVKERFGVTLSKPATSP